MGKQVYLNNDELVYLKRLISDSDPAVYTATFNPNLEDDKKAVEKELKILESLDKKI